jgi:hypothetical protein
MITLIVKFFKRIYIFLKKMSQGEPVQALKNSEEKLWKSCCFQVDSEFASFMVAVITSFTLMLFCIVQLLDPNISSDRFAIYIALLTGSANVWIPSPIIRK